MRALDDYFLASAGRGRHPEHAEPLVGVGVTEDDAVRDALLLYAAASWDAPQMRWASADELGDEALPVEDLARVAPLETIDRIRWVEGFALDDGRPTWVPAILVHLGLPVAVEPESFWLPSRAGLALADDLGAAVLAGLLDLVARDGFAVAMTRDAPLPRIAYSDESQFVFDATSDVGIPTVLARNESFEVVGMAAAATVVAARDAAFEDLVRRRVRRVREVYPPEPPTLIASSTATAYVAPDVNDAPVDLSKPALVARLRRAGLSGYAVDLTTDELADTGLSAVRVVVPGLSPIPPSVGWADHARLARVSS
ncbi:MAG: ribosomal protein methylthiotransferase accessory factor [Actinomycetota bacterium]